MCTHFVEFETKTNFKIEFCRRWGLLFSFYRRVDPFNLLLYIGYIYHQINIQIKIIAPTSNDCFNLPNKTCNIF